MEQVSPLPIGETLDHLADSDKSLVSSKLADLSKLSPEEVKLFEQAWVAIEPERRRQIMYRLVELAEDDAKLDFDSIFRGLLNDL